MEVDFKKSKMVRKISQQPCACSLQQAYSMSRSNEFTGRRDLSPHRTNAMQSLICAQKAVDSVVYLLEAVFHFSTYRSHM